MNINLETILGLEFVGEEIDTFVGILRKISDAHQDEEGIGFKIPSNGVKLEFTEEELTVVHTVYAHFKPVEQEENDISD